MVRGSLRVEKPSRDKPSSLKMIFERIQYARAELIVAHSFSRCNLYFSAILGGLWIL
jgi:hypothetical protein